PPSDALVANEPDDDLFPDDFDIEENEDGSATIVAKEEDDDDEEDEEDEEDEDDFYANLAETMDPEHLARIGDDLLELIEKDIASRTKRDEQYADGLKRTGMGDGGKDASGGAEFDGASKVVHPAITTAAIDFASRAAQELLPMAG